MIRKIFEAFGTLNMLFVNDNSKRPILDKMGMLLTHMDECWSVFREDSEVLQINRLAGQGYVAVSQDTYDILKQSVAYSSLVDGIFDVTMQPLIERLVWKGYLGVPLDKEVKGLLSLVDYRDILFRDEGREVMLRKPGQKISLGAVAKGYAVQRAAELFRQNGVVDAVINFGGTTAVMGRKGIIGLRNPIEKTGQVMGWFSVKDKIVVTSGAYEQESVRGGVKCHHIIDPRTGGFSQSDLLSVTLVGDNGAMLDALATAIFILGLEQGCHLAKKLGFQAVFVTDCLHVFVTDGLKGDLHIGQKG